MGQLKLSEQAAASSPAIGEVVLYPKTDSQLYYKDDAGTEHRVSHQPARKNALINGDFQVWQEGTSSAAMVTATYIADMWAYYKIGAMVHTGSQSTNVPTIAEAGRKILYSLLVDCTTVDAAIAAGDYCFVRTFVEGYNFVNIAGVGLCLQFWHKHTMTGTYCVVVGNGSDRSFVREYTQAVSDTWEFASVLVDATPTAGTWNYTTSSGVVVDFTLAAGTDFQGTAGTWNSALDLATSSQVNACNSTLTNFMLAGVQLEKGTVATEFDARTYQSELVACKRYSRIYGGEGVNDDFGLGVAFSGTQSNVIMTFEEMRIAPTISISTAGNFALVSASGTLLTATTVALARARKEAVTITVTVSTGLTGGDATELIANTTTDARLKILARF